MGTQGGHGDLSVVPPHIQISVQQSCSAKARFAVQDVVQITFVQQICCLFSNILLVLNLLFSKQQISVQQILLLFSKFICSGFCAARFCSLMVFLFSKKQFFVQQTGFVQQKFVARYFCSSTVHPSKNAQCFLRFLVIPSILFLGRTACIGGVPQGA